MAKNRIILVVIACFSVAVLAAPTPSFMPLKFPPRKRGMTNEEYKKEMEKWVFQCKQQRLKKSEERMMVKAREAWKRLLRVNERQWRLIEPKHEKVESLVYEMWVHAPGWGGIEEQTFRWKQWSKGSGVKSAKAPHEMTEGQRIADELVGLLEDEKSKDEEIRRKINALQQAREKAKKALPKAQRELAAVLTSPRQEAVLLLMVILTDSAAQPGRF